MKYIKPTIEIVHCDTECCLNNHSGAHNNPHGNGGDRGNPDKGGWNWDDEDDES